MSYITKSRGSYDMDVALYVDDTEDALGTANRDK